MTFITLKRLFLTCIGIPIHVIVLMFCLDSRREKRQSTTAPEDLDLILSWPKKKEKKKGFKKKSTIREKMKCYWHQTVADSHCIGPILFVNASFVQWCKSTLMLTWLMCPCGRSPMQCTLHTAQSFQGEEIMWMWRPSMATHLRMQGAATREESEQTKYDESLQLRSN